MADSTHQKARQTKPEIAVETLIRRISDDPRVAWLIGPGSQTYDAVTSAYAQMIGRDVNEFRKDFEAGLEFQEWPSH